MHCDLIKGNRMHPTNDTMFMTTTEFIAALSSFFKHIFRAAVSYK